MFFDPAAAKYSCFVNKTLGMTLSSDIPQLLGDVNTSISEVTLLLKPLKPQLREEKTSVAVPNPSPPEGMTEEEEEGDRTTLSSSLPSLPSTVLRRRAASREMQEGVSSFVRRRMVLIAT